MGKKHRKYTKENNSSDSDDNDKWLEEREWMPDLVMSGVSTFILFVVYAKTLYPSIPGGDSGELIVSAHELGVAHPPGYPLFTLMAKLSMLGIPLGNPAWRVGLMNAGCAGMAGGLLHLTVLRLTESHGSGLMAVGLFCLSHLTWTWSVTAEVFALNNLLIAALLLLAVMFDAANTVPQIKKISCLGAFVCGLSLTNQHTIVIYVAFIALWVLYRLQCMQLLSTGFLCKLSGCFVLGLMPYLYLPISAHLNTARWTWGNQATLGGFLTHLLRSEYGTFHLGKDSTGLGFSHGLSSYLENSHHNLCEVGPFLAIFGAVASINRKGCLFVFLLMLSAYTSFFAWRANLDISQPLMRGVVERFWIQSDLVMTVLACVGYHATLSFLTKKILGEEKSSMTVVFTVIGAVSIIALQFGSNNFHFQWQFQVSDGKRNYGACDHSRNTVVRDFGRALLTKLPKNAIVFTKGDLPTNSMRYLHLVEGVREDLELLDVEMMTYDWSTRLHKFHTKVQYPGDFWHTTNRVHPDGRTSFTFKSLIDANIKRAPLFVCIGMQDRDASWQGHYILLPYGVCHKIDDAANFIPEDWAALVGNYSDDWNYKWDSFPESSWEKVANDEMWHGKISSAYFMYEQGEKADIRVVKTRLLLAGYKLYFDAIRKNQKPSKMHHVEHFPSFWHKNFALVMERLLHEDHDHPKGELCKLCIQHFQQYVSEAPKEDPEIPSILEAIADLKERLPTYEHVDRAMRQVDSITQKYVERGSGGK